MLARAEVVPDSVPAVRVVTQRDDVGAGTQEPVGELRGDAGAVGDVLTVHDAHVGLELVAEPGQALLDRTSSGDAEDVGEEEKSQFRTSDAAGRSSTET